MDMNLSLVLQAIKEIPTAALVHGMPIETIIRDKAEYSPYTGLVQFKDGSRAKIYTNYYGKRVWKYIQS